MLSHKFLSHHKRGDSRTYMFANVKNVVLITHSNEQDLCAIRGEVPHDFLGCSQS